MTVSGYSHLKRSAPQAELRGWGRPGSSFLTIICFILMLIHFLPNCELSLEGGGPTHFLRLARQMVTEAEDGEDRWAQRSPPLGGLLALSGILCICEMQITDRPHFEAVVAIISAIGLSIPHRTVNSLRREHRLLISESLVFHRVVWAKEIFNKCLLN